MEKVFLAEEKWVRKFGGSAEAAMFTKTADISSGDSCGHPKEDIGLKKVCEDRRMIIRLFLLARRDCVFI